MGLSAQQIQFFDTFGFIKFPGLLNDSIDWVIAEFEQTFVDNQVIAQHDGTQRSCIFPFIDQRAKLCTLLDDPRIAGIGRSLLGEDFNYMGSDGNYYTGDTNWHRDGNHHKYRHLKIAFYLDTLDGSSGALRVIPGSHRLNDSYGTDLNMIGNSLESWGLSGPQVPAQVLDVQAGDILVFDHNLLHSAWGGGKARRMFTMNLCQRYAESDTAELRQYLSGHARFWIERNYSEVMMATADEERMKHLEQVMANDWHLAELTAKAKEAMAEPARG